LRQEIEESKHQFLKHANYSDELNQMKNENEKLKNNFELILNQKDISNSKKISDLENNYKKDFIEIEKEYAKKCLDFQNKSMNER
jgi:cell shape-determining protein MreC